MKKLLNTLYVTTQGAYLAKEGETVVIIDDLATTGGSKFEAIEKLTAATSLLVSYTPPKVVQAQYSISNNLNGAASAANFAQYPLKFDNGLTGTLYVQKAQAGSPAMMMLGIDSKAILGAKSVDLYLSNTALNIVDLHETLVGGSNQYMSYVTLPAAGSWRVNAQLLIDAFTQAQSRISITL